MRGMVYIIRLGSESVLFRLFILCIYLFKGVFLMSEDLHMKEEPTVCVGHYSSVVVHQFLLSQKAKVEMCLSFDVSSRTSMPGCATDGSLLGHSSFGKDIT